MINKNCLWAPDIIKESNGIACGDTLSISAYRDEQKLYFRFDGNACKIALKVADYLMDSFSGKNESEILDNVIRLRSGQYNEKEHWIEAFTMRRKDCVESPISLLYEILNEDLIYDIDTRENSVLACDACVSAKPINWKSNIKADKTSGWREVARKLKTIDDIAEIEIQKLGLCILSEKEQVRFSERLAQVSNKDFMLIKKLRLAVLLFNNAQQYSLPLDKRIEELAIKQIVSLKVANEEIKIVNDYIKKANLKIDSVKGVKTNRYYPKGCYRTHMDFDFLATEFDDAFKLISYLINERQFKLVVGSSVPISLKVLLNMDKEEVLTGHIHLEKILQNKYQVVIDINMGGFPLGRTGIIQCNNSENIELEDLVCISVAHLFKHEHVFIKDINDLYYLLSAKELNRTFLLDKLKEHELINLFSVAYNFLKRELALELEICFDSAVEFSQKRIDLWPFSRKSHFYIKAKDMLELNTKQFGKDEGLKETISQICGESGKIATKEYSQIITTLNERLYLYPVVIFNKYINTYKNEKLTSFCESIFRENQILVSPIGIFLIQDNSYSDFDRDLLNLQIEVILNNMRIDNTDCNLGYVMQARKDTWLY